MGTATLISVSEYLTTSYRPDREYLEGTLLERNLGERDHSTLETELATYLNSRRKELKIWVYVEQRIQVQPRRFRVPDVCVVVGPKPDEMILTRPPFICAEILSKDDRMEEMQQRIDDYLAFGVRCVWVINPRTRRAYVHTAEGSHEVKDGVLRTQAPDIAVPLSEFFEAL